MVITHCFVSPTCYFRFSVPLHPFTTKLPKDPEYRPPNISFVVNTTVDDDSSCVYINSTTLGCTLRGAIALVPQFSGPTITFAPALAGLTINLTRQIALNVNTYPILQGIQGQKAVTINGQGRTRLFSLDHDTSLEIHNLNLINGNAGSLQDENGGAIAAGRHNNIFIYNSTFANNHAYDGGAIYSPGGGSPNAQIADSTFVNNSANHYGGAAYIGGTYTSIYSTTFGDNVAGVSANAIAVSTFGNLMVNSIIDSHTAPTNIPNCSGVFQTSQNIEYPTTTNTCGSAILADPRLERNGTSGPIILRYNGGTTDTVRVVSSPQNPSPAVNAGNSSYCTTGLGTDKDQRGIARSGVCDIGATEKLPPRVIHSGPDTIGLYNNAGTFYLRNSNSTGYADITLNFGSAGNLPVTGDWNGDGIDTIGVYDPNTGVFQLRDTNTTGPADYYFTYGNPGDRPLAGCWDETMLDQTSYRCKDGIGVFRPGSGSGFFLHYGVQNGGLSFADYYTSTINFANPGDLPVVGDWDGDGYDSIGLFRPSNAVWYLTNSINNTNFAADYSIVLGGSGSLPVTGDWTGLGPILLGYTFNGGVYLRSTLTSGQPDIIFTYGAGGWLPVAGRWNSRAPRGMAVVAPNIIVPVPVRKTPQPGDGGGLD